jgi:hypothetical protein
MQIVTVTWGGFLVGRIKLEMMNRSHTVSHLPHFFFLRSRVIVHCGYCARDELCHNGGVGHCL